MKRIIICGFGSSGVAAFASIRRSGQPAEILIIDPKEKDVFHPCGLPYALAGEADADKLSENINLSSSSSKRIRAALLSVSPANKTILVSDGQTYSYDKLIIALGARPFVPAFNGINDALGRGLFTLASMADLTALQGYLKRKKKCIVIGGGSIGVESASAMTVRVDDVSLIEARSNILSGFFDADMAAEAESYLSLDGVNVIGGKSVSDILIKNGFFSGVAADGEVFDADIGILAAGFVPVLPKFDDDSIRTEPSGIIINEFMETNIPDIFAAGDCTRSFSVIDKAPFASKIAVPAYRQGEAAGTNAAGGRVSYKGSVGILALKAGGLEAASAGFTLDECSRRGFDAASGKIKTRLFPEYFDYEGSICVKVIAEKKTGRILGAQAVAKSGAASRINMAAMAIEHGIALDDFTAGEYAYTPGINEIEDPLFRAASFCLRRI